ncbi:MAG: hypothetical protein ACYCZR_14180, partial [Burkholderiales bacterium]
KFDVSPRSNILAGGGIGYVVDRETGAGFDYPNTITVMLHKIGQAIGLPTSPTATSNTTTDATAAPKK